MTGRCCHHVDGSRGGAYQLLGQWDLLQWHLVHAGRGGTSRNGCGEECGSLHDCNDMAVMGVVGMGWDEKKGRWIELVARPGTSKRQPARAWAAPASSRLGGTSLFQTPAASPPLAKRPKPRQTHSCYRVTLMAALPEREPVPVRRDNILSVTCEQHTRTTTVAMAMSSLFQQRESAHTSCELCSGIPSHTYTAHISLELSGTRWLKCMHRMPIIAHLGSV